MAKTTKRRKAWVNFYEDGSDDGCNFSSKVDAKGGASTAYRMTQVPFIELRRGDVVLSREDRLTLAAVVRWMDDNGAGKFKVLVPPELQALLRGGR
jgi:hypothetical protein